MLMSKFVPCIGISFGLLLSGWAFGEGGALGLEDFMGTGVISSRDLTIVGKIVRARSSCDAISCNDNRYRVETNRVLYDKYSGTNVDGDISVISVCSTRSLRLGSVYAFVLRRSPLFESIADEQADVSAIENSCKYSVDDSNIYTEFGGEYYRVVNQRAKASPDHLSKFLMDAEITEVPSKEH